jgi:uncharacterized surface protein with fasciclin (FAS1) repeats
VDVTHLHRGRSGALDSYPGWPMSPAAITWVAILALTAAPRLPAQEPDPAEAYGIYRPPDSSAAAAGAAERAEADSVVAGGTATDSAAESIRRNRVEEAADDTSLTARMDVWRGGGLRREEFPDLRESAALAGRYTVFLDLIGRDPAGAALGDTARVTVLAPTDSAFAELPAGAVARLRSDLAARARWAGALLLAGDRPVGALLEAGTVETLGGAAIRVTRGADGVPRVGEAKLIQPDMTARNGMLHGVDRVMLPDSTVGKATSAVP